MTRLRWGPAARAVAALCLWAAGGCAPSDSPLDRPYTPAHAAMVAAAGGCPAEARWLAGCRGAAFAGATDALRRATAAVELDGARARGEEAGARAAAAVARLWRGEAEPAARELAAAVEREPDDPRLWNDLAVARLAVAAREADPLGTLDALEAAARAAELAPAAAAPRCNQAAALERLALPGEARRAWRACRRRTADPAGRAEASAALARLATAGESGDRGSGPVADRQAAREEAMLELLPRWGERLLAGREAPAARSLDRARAIGRALAAAGGDATVADAVAAIDRRAGDPRALEELARGHLAYRRGTLLLRTSYELSGAAAAFGEAEARLREIGSPVARWAAKWLAAGNLLDDEMPELLARYGALLAATDAARYPALAGRLHWGLAMVRARQGHWTDAMDHLERARDRFAAAGEREFSGAIEGLLAEAEDALGREDRAWEHRRRAAALLAGSPDSRYLHNLLWQAAETARTGGRLRAARHFNDEGLRVAVRGGNPLARAEAHLYRGRTLLDLGRPAAALAAYAAAERAGRRIAHPPLAERVRARLAYTVGEARRRLAPAGALAELDRAVAFYRGRGLEIELARVHLARARARRDLGRAAGAEADLEAAVASLERQRERLGAPALGRSFHEARREVFDELVRLRAETLGRPLAALAAADRSRAPAGGPGASPLIERPPAGVDLLVYARVLPGTVEERLYRWHGTDGRWTLARLDVPAREVEAAGDALLRPGAAASADLRDLARRLLPERLVAPRLVLVPDGELAGLPFAALPHPADGRPLAAERAVLTAPSVAAWAGRSAERPRDPARPPRRALVVAEPAIDRRLGLPALPGARAEAAAVAAAYPEAATLEGGEATRAAVLAALAGREVLHFAGHALAPTGQPAAAELVLAPPPGAGPGAAAGASLTAVDLAAADLDHLRLAVLSACATAAAPGRRTTPVAGLAAALLDAGVPAVLGTLRPTDDTTARDFLTHFHRAHRETGDPAASLHRAQLHFIHHPDPHLRHPRHWSGFVLVGEGRREDSR